MINIVSQVETIRSMRKVECGSKSRRVESGGRLTPPCVKAEAFLYLSNGAGELPRVVVFISKQCGRERV